MPELESFSTATLVWIAIVMLAAGFTHGVIGFGFPIVATPLLALALDIKEAILISLVPTLVMTTLNAFRGGQLRESAVRFWFLPICLVVGSYLGSRLLIVAPSEPFILLLAFVVLAYLNMERLGQTDLPVVRRHPAATGVVFGLLAGLFESTVNVAGPALLVYFMLLGMNPRPLVQTLNFSFIAGKTTQIATWTVAGGIGWAAWLSTAPWAAIACVTLLIGQRLHDRVAPRTYARWLRAFLWAMAVLLCIQFARALLKS